MTFRQDGRIFRAMAWNGAEREELLTANKAAVDLAFSLEQNEFNGETYLELRVEDFRAPVASGPPFPPSPGGSAGCAGSRYPSRWTGSLMARWQKPSGSAPGLFALALAGFVYVSLGERRAPPKPAGVERLDPARPVEMRGGDGMQLKGATRRLHHRIRGADLRRTAAPPSARHHHDRQPRRPQLRGHRQGGHRRRQAVVGGPERRRRAHRLRRADGDRGQATYADGEGIVRVPGPVTFSRARMGGTGIGFTYDKNARHGVAPRPGPIAVAPAEADLGHGRHRPAPPARPGATATCASSAA